MYMGSIFLTVLLAVIFMLVVRSLRECAEQQRILDGNKKFVEGETKRLNEMPGLDTTYMLRAPDKLMDSNYRTRWARTYGTRYNRILIFDDLGAAYVALACPAVIETLRANEYTQESFWVPFVGPGEAQGGDPVTVNGTQIEIYPNWLKATATETSQKADWQLWAKIEKHWRGLTDWNYQNGLASLHVEKRQHSIRELRRRLHEAHEAIETAERKWPK